MFGDERGVIFASILAKCKGGGGLQSIIALILVLRYYYGLLVPMVGPKTEKMFRKVSDIQILEMSPLNYCVWR